MRSSPEFQVSQGVGRRVEQRKLGTKHRDAPLGFSLREAFLEGFRFIGVISKLLEPSGLFGGHRCTGRWLCRTSGFGGHGSI
jgi:hypothetical protein